MRRLIRHSVVVLAFALFLPVAIGATLSYVKGWPANWHSADWSSSNTLPAARSDAPASIRIYAARSGRWRGIFAVHHWIVVKLAGKPRYDRYDVVGWGQPVRKNNYPPDGYWYSNKPTVVHQVEGPEAAKLIPKIEAAVDAYPWPEYGQYTVWPGPNSNTFVAYILRQVPELKAEMDSTGVGKDYLGNGLAFAPTPSGTGWQVSYNGLIGLAVALEEGFELHVLGTTIGLDPDDLAVKLPSLGRLSLLDWLGSSSAAATPASTQ